MPRQMSQPIVYVVKGEGVRDNSWELQQPARPLVYTNPPVEQLDSVPTPLGSDLSIRIFEKGTKPVPNFLPSPSSAPATSVVAAQASSMSPSIPQPKQPRDASSAASPASIRPSSQPPNASSGTPKPVVSDNPPVPTADVSQPCTKPFLYARRLRNFRKLSAPIIADPTKIPRADSTMPAVTRPPSSPQAQRPRLAQAPVPPKVAAQGKQVKSAPTAPSVLSRPTPAVSAAVPSPQKVKLRAPVAPTSFVGRQQDTAPMVLSPPKPRPRPSAPAVPPQMKAKASPPSTTKATPPLPELSIPGPSSPTKAMRQQQQIASPSAFGRWKTSAPGSPSAHRSPPLPSPAKPRAPAVAEKTRSKPWDKHKASSAAQTSFEVQRKAMDSIVAKALSRQAKPAKTLPPLTPLTPPVHPSHAGPVSPKVPQRTSAADSLSKRVSSVSQEAGKLIRRAPKEATSDKEPTPKPPRPVQKPAASEQLRPMVDGRRDGRKNGPITMALKAPPKALVKTPVEGPATVLNEAARKVPNAASSKPPERKLLQRDMCKPGDAVVQEMPSSAGPSVDALGKDLAARPSAAAIPTASISAKKLSQSAKPTSDVRPAASPRSSIDGYEIGTAARPIVTKEDQALARREREAASVRAPKAPCPSEQLPHRKASSSEIRKEEQAGSKSVAGPSAPAVSKVPAPKAPAPKAPAPKSPAPKSPAPKAPGRTETNDLFNSEIQESMKSVIEQVLWVIQHFKRKNDISNHEEMKNNKKRILRCIQNHLGDAVSAPPTTLSVKEPSPTTSSAADSALSRQSSLKGKESGKPREDLRHADLKDIRMYEVFRKWRKHLEKKDASLQELAVTARQLRNRVSSADRDTFHFTVPELLKRLGELEELAFSIRKLTGRMRAAGREMGVNRIMDTRIEDEFQDSYRVLMSAARWVWFLSEQTFKTWEKLGESPDNEAKKFAAEAYDAVVKTKTTAADETSASEGIVQAMRGVKSAVSALKKEIDFATDEASLSWFAIESTRNLRNVCLEAEKYRKQQSELAATSSPPDQDRLASRSTTERSDPVPRRPRQDDKPEGSQESRDIKRGTPGPGVSTAAQSSASPSTGFEAKGRAKTPNGTFAATAGPRIPPSPKSLPEIPRRPPNAEASVAVTPNQAGQGTQRPAGGNIPRWMSKDRLNLRTLMQSARNMDQTRDEKPRDGVGGTKRKVEENIDRKGSDSDSQTCKKRRVKFAPVLVQGEQSTPYSKRALQSLFFDGYDLLGNSSELQKKAVEERASQLSRGSVIATFGFIRSYVAALKAAREGRNCQRPVWVRLPYTPTMKRDISRFKERRGNGLRSAPGP